MTKNPRRNKNEKRIGAIETLKRDDEVRESGEDEPEGKESVAKWKRIEGVDIGEEMKKGEVQ